MQLSPPTSGPFAGITIMYDRNNTATSKLSGNSNGFGGAIYMPAGQLQLTGNGGTLRSRVIVVGREDERQQRADHSAVTVS